MIKSLAIKLPSRRLPSRLEISDKLTAYDIDNLYPERIDRLINASGTATSCTSIYQDFLMGEGFVDESLNDLVINRRGETLLDLLELITYDFSRFNGFAVKVDYNMLLEVSGLTHVDFKYCRLGLPDSANYINQILVHNNWEQDYNKTRKPYEKPKYYDRYNPIDSVIAAQIKRDKGIRQFKGQIFYWTPRRQSYPLAPLDAVIEDVETDAQTKYFKNRGIKTNFMAGHIFKDPTKYETEEEEREQQENLEKFVGAENVAKIFWLPGFPADLLQQKINLFEKVDIQDIDRLYEYTETSVKANIIDHLKIPQVLFSKYDGNSLGQGSQIFQEASKQFNLVTRGQRMKIQQALEKMAANFPLLSGRDFTIKELYSSEEQRWEEATIQPNENVQSDESDN